MKYIKKPVIVEAFQYLIDDEPDWFAYASDVRDVRMGVCANGYGMIAVITTKKGEIVEARHGDMIVLLEEDSIYAYPKITFDKIYDKVDE